MLHNCSIYKIFLKKTFTNEKKYDRIDIMTMHLVRGMTSLSTKRRKMKKKPGWNKALLEHEKFLKKMGVTGAVSNKGIHDIPDYKADIRKTAKTSDSVPDNGSRKRAQQYTGTFIQGIATMHKSNLVPVTKEGNPKDYATMRRN